MRSDIQGLLAIVVILLAGVVLAACSSGASNATSQSNGSGHAVVGSTIVIKNFAFTPDSLSVTPGATVTVENEDGVTHTLTSNSGAFSTGDLSAHATTHFKAPAKPGTYPYRCSVHQFMTGTLVVT